MEFKIFKGAKLGSFSNLKVVVIEYALCFLFKATNSKAEYEALLACLKLAKQVKVESIRILIGF